MGFSFPEKYVTFLPEKNRDPRSFSLPDQPESKGDPFSPDEISATTQDLAFLRRVERQNEEPEDDECSLHLVDTCSWPHCNPTCPPLINPYTGDYTSRKRFLYTDIIW